MELFSSSVLSDVNVPNHIDDLDDFLNGSWDHKAINQGDIDALYAELNQSAMLTPVASPVTEQQECDVVFQKNEDYGALVDQIACSAILTPQASPRIDEANDLPLQELNYTPLQSVQSAYSFNVQQAVKNCNSDDISRQVGKATSSKLMEAVHQHLTKIIKVTSENLTNGVINNGHQIKAEPIFDLAVAKQSTVENVSYQSSKEAFLTQPSFSPSAYIPYYSEHSVPSPCEYPVKIEEQAFSPPPLELAEESPKVDECCKSTDPIEPAPGMSCAEYLSSVQLASDCVEAPEPPAGYFIYVPSNPETPNAVPTTPFQILVHSDRQQKPTAIPVLPVSQKPQSSVKPFVQAVDYVQIQNNYVLPSDGTIRTYPVEEIYCVDRQSPSASILQPAPKKKPRKANISYGTEFYCHICRKEFGKRGSFQQHWRQKHEENRPFRCETCGKSYLTEQDLRQHEQNHDPGMKQWKCTKCDNRYRHMKDRDRHYDTHHGTPAHPCVVEGCEKAFARRDHMLAHLVSHDNRTMREMRKAQAQEEKEQNRRQRGRKRKAE